MMTTDQIRLAFIDFFKQRKHQHVPSAALVPRNDQSLLFTNAGMVQFKEVFLGIEKPDYTRAVTTQKCVRAGGKHNDLENVGYTARHHTFFEMLGNFSFGDYFKFEAIQFAWEFLTKTLNLPQEKLWITVFEKDTDSEEIWLKKIGIDPARFSKIGSKDNFWSMGETGPCGPCTEIFYDHGPNVAGGPPGSDDQEGDRYVEIWNLVFMQYNRLADGTLEPLPQSAVDTGMGLERLTAILQGVVSNYDIDIFQKLIKTAASIVNTQDLSHPSLKVIADHIRACGFLIADGVLPSNEGRGYVLRRIIRRAVRHGYQFGTETLFFYQLVGALIDTMAGAYPELRNKHSLIEETLKAEETQFQATLSHGMKIFDAEIEALNNKTIPGALAFKLYDTYGFPLDLTEDLAKEKGLTVDIKGFNHAMAQQKMRAKKASQFTLGEYPVVDSDQTTDFLGYTKLSTNSVITGIYCDNKPISEVSADKKAIIILDQTPFYGESGGQVGDVGEITLPGDSLFQVLDTQKAGKCILHIGQVIKGQYQLGDAVTAAVDTDKRIITAANHTATHLLHSALRHIIGTHVEQKGSLVEANKLRFDFSHASGLTQTEIKAIESLVNQVIRQNLPVECIETTAEAAKKMGAMALFGEKYGATVRVLKVGDFSMELCGGTHAKKTGDIGLFKIINQSGIAAGIRRIEAVTGKVAEAYINHQQDQLLAIHDLLKSTNDNVLEKLSKLQVQLKEQEKTIKRLKQQSISKDNLEIQSTEIAGVTIISSILDNVDMTVLRNKIDQYKSGKKQVVAALATIHNQKPAIVVGVSQAITDKIHAGTLINFIAKQIGGKGGGRPDMAQAGGGNPEGLSSAMASVYDWVRQSLS